MQQQETPPGVSFGPQMFKDALYGGAGTGWLTIFYTPTRQTVWFPVTAPVPELDLQQNCYLGLGLRRQHSGRNRARGKADDIIGIPGLWLDLDYDSPGAHKARHPLPPDQDAALSLLDAAPYKPSLIVHSGHGLQVYWLFKEVACFDSQADREAFGRLCRGWQQLFQQAGRDRGWHVDSTADLARVLRIPGTYNLKTGEAREVVVREANSFRYSPSDFSDFAESDTPPPLPAVEISPSSNGLLDLRSLRVSPRIKYLIQHGDTIGQYPSRSEALFAVLTALTGAGYDDPDIARLCLLETHGISALPREKGRTWMAQELKRARSKANSLTRHVEGEPEDADDLMTDIIPPPRPIVEGLLHEGMLLFGGKSKRGKSWLMLDLALSVATGSCVWRHFDVPEPQPVLYVALEDGRGRIKQRLHDIRPGVRTNGYLHLLYNFPLLNNGGLEKLRGYIESGRYRLIVIDVLARVEPAARGGSEKTYHDIYRMFAPLQDLHRQHPQCLAMITHLRKAEAEDIFDTLHGSVAYQGVQDALWVLERPPADSAGALHTRQNDGVEQTLHLSFAGGHWEFLGHEADMKLSRDRQAILELWEETDRSLSIDEMFKALSRPRDRYQSLKKTVYRMMQDDQIVRIARGRYVPTRHAVQGRLEAVKKGTKGRNGTS